MIMHIDEMTETDLGLTQGRYGDWESVDLSNVWYEVDTHRCAMGGRCAALHGPRGREQAARLGIHLHGQYDQPEWITPWRVEMNGRTFYVCEDCASMLDDIAPILGFTVEA